MQASDYERDLFYERELRTVTANTRVDGWEFLRMAGEIGITGCLAARKRFDWPQGEERLAGIADRPERGERHTAFAKRRDLGSVFELVDERGSHRIVGRQGDRSAKSGRRGERLVKTVKRNVCLSNMLERACALGSGIEHALAESLRNAVQPQRS